MPSIVGREFLREGQQATPVHRRAILCVAPEVVLDLILNLNRDRRITIAGIPEDAVLVSAGYDFAMASFVLRLESETFDPVSEGEEAPFLYPILTDHGPRKVT